MSYSESSGWKKSWVVGAIALVAIAFGTARSWRSIRPAPGPDGPLEGMIRAMPTDPASQALAREAAAEAVRILGNRGGRVVLVIPIPKPLHQVTYGAAYEAGLRAGLQGHSSVQFDGIYFAEPPYAGNDFQNREIPNLECLQDIRKTHPKADMIVSFLGLPRLNPEEQKLWLEANPPKMIVVEVWPSENRLAARQAIESGLVETVVVNAAPTDRPEDAHAPSGVECVPSAAPSKFDVLRKP